MASLTQALVLVPTHEQTQAIESGPKWCSCSVVRLIDLINRRALRTGTDNIRMISLYEMDQLLSRSSL